MNKPPPEKVSRIRCAECGVTVAMFDRDALPSDWRVVRRERGRVRGWGRTHRTYSYDYRCPNCGKGAT